ncbi:hypothetical protein SeMB42_g03304 [Synchytrium endobioticum]|uniref:OTU domain-containing protein n=1 Tax=Synchytrium endobioticum TaxID=286115 RepID=A0A507D9B6_9FUNG|nr:hypothetical protein SeMB42_g03304 [Synchytrium endobioticum]
MTRKKQQQQARRKQRSSNQQPRANETKREGDEDEANGKQERRRQRGKIDLSGWGFSGHSKALEASLHKLGLRLKDMNGDGNCLFSSLSDQVFGNPSQHSYIRTRVVQHIGSHRAQYEPFVALEEDGGFDAHVDRMGRAGCYGGNAELVAFARDFNAEVFVHQANAPVWIIVPDAGDRDGQAGRIRVHVAYHSWEHYSSVRNMDGPMDGPPAIVVRQPGATKEPDSDAPGTPAAGGGHPSSLETMIMKAVGLDDVDRVRTKLKACSGDPNRVIYELYEEIEKEGEDNKGGDISAGAVDRGECVASSPKSVPQNGAEGVDCAAPLDASREAPRCDAHDQKEPENTAQPAAATARGMLGKGISTAEPAKERKPSNRERKDAAKKARKENNVNKKRMNAVLSSTSVVASKASVGILTDGVSAISI